MSLNNSCAYCDRPATATITTPTGGEGRCSLPVCNWHLAQKMEAYDV